MLIVGLTGGIGSGKSEAANIFSELGIPVIDTDAIAHELTQAGSATLNRIIEQFGERYLLDDGSLNRKLLAQHIFGNSEKKTELEAIMHPAIRQVVEERLTTLNESPYVIIVVPLLFETSFENLVHRSLVIDAGENEQISRTRERDGRESDEIRRIMAQQMNRTDRLERADDTLDNSGSLDELRESVEQLHQRYLSEDRL